MTTNKNEELVKQWVSKIINVESKSEESLRYLNNILGPLKENDLKLYDQTSDAIKNVSSAGLSNFFPSSNLFTHQIIFKIDEKVFINEIKIYEKVVADSSVLKIEALLPSNHNNNNVKSESELNEKKEWLTIWESVEPIEPAIKPRIFTPIIAPTPFKTDTIKFTISGSLHLINAVEIYGNKLAIDEDAIEAKNNQIKKLEKENVDDKFKDYSLISRDLFKLVLNDLMADVYFEVDGKIVPAHRNILVYRSEYFRAMLSSKSSFKESKNSNHTQTNPIYIKNMSFEVFTELLNYIYTGCVNYSQIPYHVLIGLMRASDLVNLMELQQLCLFYLSLILNKENVIEIYREASETPDILKQVLELCFDMITVNFGSISKSIEFCSLSQELMVKILENVVPKLNRVTSYHINNQETINLLDESNTIQNNNDNSNIPNNDETSDHIFSL